MRSETVLISIAFVCMLGGVGALFLLLRTMPSVDEMQRSFADLPKTQATSSMTAQPGAKPRTPVVATSPEPTGGRAPTIQR